MATKNILMIAQQKKVEALRMATGLTLLDDMVSVLVCGVLEDSADAGEQLEALAFSDVPVTQLDKSDDIPRAMAQAISQADVVYIL